MSNYDYDLGIIGGGAAGLTAAAGSARFGAKTLLIEKAERLGGDCLHCGCVPSKTLIHTAGVWALARRAAEFGLPPIVVTSGGSGRRHGAGTDRYRHDSAS
jgi:pyruvate/2-oxoglutarate dehydrogenase complex dihydrolipoamide dehydrogenase (E3) component